MENTVRWKRRACFWGAVLFLWFLIIKKKSTAGIERKREKEKSERSKVRSDMWKSVYFDKISFRGCRFIRAGMYKQHPAYYWFFTLCFYPKYTYDLKPGWKTFLAQLNCIQPFTESADILSYERVCLIPTLSVLLQPYIFPKQIRWNSYMLFKNVTKIIDVAEAAQLCDLTYGIIGVFKQLLTVLQSHMVKILNRSFTHTSLKSQNKSLFGHTCDFRQLI